MLPRMIDLQRHFAGCRCDFETRLIHSYEAYRQLLGLQRLGTAETGAL